MTSNSFADSVVNGMLSWLKGFASWVLRLFNLAGSGGISPLAWLSDNWLQLLIFLLVIGVATDIIVWLIRWRPYWVWFRKKRVVVDDEDFFAAEKAPRKKFRNALFIREDARDGGERPPVKKARPAAGAAMERPRPPKSAARPRTQAGKAPLGASSSQRRPARQRPAPAQQATRRPAPDIFEDDLFKIDPADPQARNQREDAVFNVSNLPGAQRPKKRKHEEDAHDDLFTVD